MAASLVALVQGFQGDSSPKFSISDILKVWMELKDLPPKWPATWLLAETETFRPGITLYGYPTTLTSLSSLSLSHLVNLRDFSGPLGMLMGNNLEFIVVDRPSLWTRNAGMDKMSKAS